MLEYQGLEQEKLAKNEEELFSDVPICGGNLSTPVVDKAYYITEIHDKLGIGFT